VRRLLLLVGLVVLAAVLLAALPAGAYHPPRLGNAIQCPKGTLQNAAGTTCTDRQTGKWVEPIRKHTIFPTRHPEDRCPEGWKLKKPGNGCKKMPWPPR
jgi:hypothetical protein